LLPNAPASGFKIIEESFDSGEDESEMSQGLSVILQFPLNDYFDFDDYDEDSKIETPCTPELIPIETDNGPTASKRYNNTA
jgi:hypothetical protein